MARKTHTKKERSREAFVAAKQLGSPTMVNCGGTYLNIMKHYCLRKPYINDGYNETMFREIKRMSKGLKNLGVQNG